jgi:glyoxylase-like metal-dependent hydrolase (beta-lactamase superfamily II)
MTQPDVLVDSPDRNVRRLAVGPYDNRVYLVGDPETRDLVIIDAANEPGAILAAVEGWIPRAILTTHGHLDHVAAVPAVQEELGVPFRIHPADEEIAGRSADQPLTDGERIAVGGLNILAVHTPGHTPGSTCFELAPQLFTGDTLFPGGPGATRFEYSSFPQIMDSLEQRLFIMGDETVVFPGHGAETTLGAERAQLDEWRERGW